MQPGEQVLFQIKRHPMGLIGTYFVIGLTIVLLVVLAVVLVPQAGAGGNAGQLQHYVYGAVGIVVFVLLGILLISNIVYWGNRWVLTSDSITQVLQYSLFSKEMAQLSLGNLEDVTAEQHGILAHIFNYGILKAETAGEREKFLFRYCPNPTHYAQMVLQAREAFEQNVREAGGASRSSYTGGAAPQAPAAPVGSYEVPTDDDLQR